MHRFLLLLMIASTPLLSGCLFGGMAGGAVAGSDAANDTRPMVDHATDVYLATVIDARLAAEKDLPSRWISVEVINGEATITGSLPKQEQIDRAVYIAQNTTGIRSVRNEMQIGTPEVSTAVSDSWITTKVKRLLFEDALVSGFSVHVETVDGKVYLQGIVDNQAQRQRAVDITRSVEGVVAVVDLLQVK